MKYVKFLCLVVILMGMLIGCGGLGVIVLLVFQLVVSIINSVNIVVDN